RMLCLPPGSATIKPLGYDRDHSPSPGQGIAFTPQQHAVTLPPEQTDRDFRFECAITNLPDWNQVDAPWGGRQYARHILGPTKTIAGRGCALTSLAMVL